MNKLTDFPEETLHVMLRAIQQRQAEFTSHVRGIRQHGPDAVRLLEQKLEECKEEISHLQLAEIQVATAIVMVRTAKTAILN